MITINEYKAIEMYVEDLKAIINIFTPQALNKENLLMEIDILKNDFRVEMEESISQDYILQDELKNKEIK